MKRRKSVRLKDYDYSEPGYYFVTICANDQNCLFGEVVEGEMRLNQWGVIVKEEWLRTPILRPHVELDEFVVMPNHFHAIVNIVDDCRGTARRAPTYAKFGQPVAGSLSTIIGAFKSAVTKRINVLRNTHCISIWQRNYYERVIRTENELFEIRQYIQENPLKWDLDPENPNRVVGARRGTPVGARRGTPVGARRALPLQMRTP